MKSKSKALLLMVCAVLLVVSTIFGTLAYLTAEDAVTNTFTVGNVGLNLDEAKTNENGVAVESGERTEEGNEYHLLPGHTYVKDPTVTVTANSDDAYVRMIVKVVNVDQLKAALPGDEYYYGTTGMFLLEKLCGGWDSEVWTMAGYTEEGTTGIYEFRYKEIVAKSDAETELPALFETITVPGEIDNEHLAKLDAVDILVEANAIQADGFDTADLAWAQFK